MFKINHLRSLTCILLVLFLFAPIVSRSFSQESFEHNIKKTGYSKHSLPATNKAEGQLICEEKEKEEKGTNHFSESLPIVFLLEELIYAPANEQSRYHLTEVFSFYGSLPLYLGKRSLLI